ncbi:serine/threonine-protein kinase [Kitasatospora purpeofusca]|uniref:serine/threonine-protein kinase n=1 Tax=Kitasatospora purpeofusca TaxID=67352 RepID=UPI002A59905C|nr:serine/threonine-protein kinase [Kitasatospora purpeofusca]MDY0810769.1 serine/threonine-protein kinase [Kitasatospora purpeofusca]
MEPLEADDPQWVGEYRVLGRLGSGGMGRVYLGRTAGGRTVAVKLVHRDLAGDPEFRARFRHEVAAARRVGGVWTAPVLDADTESGHPWVATGYVAGPALTFAVREFGPLPDPAVRALGVGLAEALAHVHGLGLVHRDVKPSNVLLTLDGPRLIDFGITRALDATAGLTRSGQVFGSPGFMSPEQANGLPAGPAGDVFSLGAVLAFAATGTMPFGSGVSAPVLLYRVLHEEPDLSGLSGPMYAVIRACLAKDPAARPVPGQLRRFLDGDGAAAARLGRGDWLPPGLAAAVGRSAVQLLDLEGERGTGWTAPGPAPAPASTVPPSVPPPQPPQPPPPPALPTWSAPGRATSPRRRYGALAAGLAAVLLLGGGGYLLLDGLRGDEQQVTASTPAPSAPAASAPAPSATTAGPGIVPAKYLGKWFGQRTAANGDVTTVTLTIVQSAQSEEKSKIRAETPSTGTWCEGAWTLSDADDSHATYASRVTGSSPGDQCITDRSVYRRIRMQPDGALQYCTDLLKPDQYIVLQKLG